MRPADPRDNPGLVLAALMFGLTALLVPPVDGRERAEAVPPPAAAVAAAPVAAAPIRVAAPKQLVVAMSARPVVLTDRPVRAGDRTVALTFDDGPDPRWTPAVLATLRRYDAVATFCMIGKNAGEHPDLVRDVVDAGMRLCDHTRDHPADLTVLPQPQQESEILGGRQDLAAATDADVAYFRAPGGHFAPPLLAFAAGHGMQPLGWAVDPRDWAQPGVPAIVDAVERNVHPGAVVLLHDGGGHRQQTLDALDDVLPRLVAQGYRFTFPTP